MSLKRKLMKSLMAMVLLGMVITSCSPVSVEGLDLATKVVDGPDLPVSSPEVARDKTLSYLHESYPSIPVSTTASWQGKDISSDEAVATRNFLYSFRNWTVSVVTPLVTPKNRIFTVIVKNDVSDFQWAGLIDAYGKVERMGRLLAIPFPPTFTAIPTIITLPTETSAPPTITPTAVSCNDATFLEDVTIPDGTEFTPGTQFLKVWRLRNVGTCTWTTDYELVLVGGNRMSALRVVPLAETVRPGESVELGVNMVAPTTPGNYQAFWMLSNANGARFGIGDNADDSFWVNIDVVGTSSDRDFKFDFATNYCAAIWRSATGRLSCGDSTSAQSGFVLFLPSPNLENRHENERTLWVHPNQGKNGWIEGSFPPVTVESGDSFRAWIGCMQGNEACDLTFYLSYIDEDNRVYTLERWPEVYDKLVTVIDMDLSSLAGQTVQFILGVETNADEFGDQQGFWFVPRIEQ